MMKSVI